jgi:hypothetical protein
MQPDQANVFPRAAAPIQLAVINEFRTDRSLIALLARKKLSQTCSTPLHNYRDGILEEVESFAAHVVLFVL